MLTAIHPQVCNISKSLPHTKQTLVTEQHNIELHSRTARTSHLLSISLYQNFSFSLCFCYFPFSLFGFAKVLSLFFSLSLSFFVIFIACTKRSLLFWNLRNTFVVYVEESDMHYNICPQNIL